MGVDAQIEAALAARLDAIGAHPVVWVGDETFAPVAGTTYLEGQFFRTSTSRFAIAAGQPHIRLGFLQVAVMSPISNGLSAAMVAAEAVQAHFPDGSHYGPAVVQQTPHIETAFENEAWLRVPVTVYWRATA